MYSTIVVENLANSVIFLKVRMALAHGEVQQGISKVCKWRSVKVLGGTGLSGWREGARERGREGGREGRREGGREEEV